MSLFKLTFEKKTESILISFSLKIPIIQYSLHFNLIIVTFILYKLSATNMISDYLPMGINESLYFIDPLLTHEKDIQVPKTDSIIAILDTILSSIAILYGWSLVRIFMLTNKPKHSALTNLNHLSYISF